MLTGTRIELVTELVVLWQQPTTRAMIPVGLLGFDGTTYRFEYLPAAVSADGFRPLLGFKDLATHYDSDELFPLFHERIMDPARDDFEHVLEGLQLDPRTATPWEQLVHSGGGSEGDTLQVTPLPCADGDGWVCTALASGLRYLQAKSVRTVLGESTIYSEEQFESVLGALGQGDPLTVRREIGNDYNPDALVVFTERNELVGYLPDWLARFIAPALPEGEGWQIAHVERVNSPEAGWHLRLVVTVTGAEPFDLAVERLRSGTALRY